jgi:hypothetical protein
MSVKHYWSCLSQEDTRADYTAAPSIRDPPAWNRYRSRDWSQKLGGKGRKSRKKYLGPDIERESAVPVIVELRERLLPVRSLALDRQLVLTGAPAESPSKKT